MCYSEKSPFVAAASLSLLVVAWSFAQTRTAGQAQSLREVKTYRVEVEQSYGNAKDISLSLAELTTRLFGYAGVSVLASSDPAPDACIKIKATGEALGARYYAGSRSVYRYTGAKLSGEISISAPGAVPVTKGFSAERERDSSVIEVGTQLSDNTESAAPFRRTLAIPGSFLQILLSTIQELYGTEPVIRALDDSEPNVREMAILALVPLNDPRTFDLLIRMLKNDKSEDVRTRCAMTLVNMGDPRAVEPVAAALRDKQVGDEYFVRTALQKLVAAGGSETLISNARHENPELRAQAIEALGKRKDLTAFAVIREALKDSNLDVRWNAADALGDLRDPRGLEPLLSALQDQDSGMRSHAAEALGGFKDEKAEVGLIDALHDADSSVRYSAVKALGKLNSSKGLQSMLAALDDKDSRVGIAVEIALRDYRDPAAVPALLEQAKHANPKVRSAMLQQLTAIGDPRAFDCFIAALDDPDGSVRNEASLGLERLKDSRAVPALIRALEDQEGGQFHAVIALGILKDPRAVEPLIKVLETAPEGGTPFQAARALSLITGKEFGEDPAKWKKWWAKNRKKFGLASK